MYNKTKSLEFKNFRKFADFPAIEFNDITFLVGANNSGKSTFVKAVMLVFNYLQQRDLRTVDFNANGVDVLNIVSYERALHKSISINNTEEIQIAVTIHDYKFDLRLKSHKETSKATVLNLECSFWGTTALQIDPVARKITIVEAPSQLIATFGDPKKDAAREELYKLKQELEIIDNPFSVAYIEMNAAIEKLSETLEEGNEIAGWSAEFDYQSDDMLEVLTGLTNLIASMPMLHRLPPEIHNEKNGEEEEEEEEAAEFINDSSSVVALRQSYHYDSDRDNWIVRLKLEQQNINGIQSLYTERNGVMQFLTGIKNVVTTSEIVYLPATLNKQSALFFVRDEKNPLAQTIHNYYQNADEDDKEVKGFIKSWLNEFKVGDDFKITPIEGEAYTMEISQNGFWISLADKGMGAIQATLLILRLASLIKNQQGKKESIEATKNNDEKNYIVVIEEPELNLHPALQSKLCDLFFEVNSKYFIEFIIETHSEYIIRRSQVITAENNFESPVSDMDFHPFSALYFPEGETGKPYSMNYQADGSFENSFGSGFFDASFKTSADLFRINKLKARNERI